MGLFRKGKTCIIANFHRPYLVNYSHSRERKTLSYSQINVVPFCSQLFSVIISVIGDEILKGQTPDTNSSFICRHLFSWGVKVRRVGNSALVNLCMTQKCNLPDRSSTKTHIGLRTGAFRSNLAVYYVCRLLGIERVCFFKGISVNIFCITDVQRKHCLLQLSMNI